MITQIEDYFTLGCGRCDRFGTPDCSVKAWAEGLATLRRVSLAAGLSEVVKWGHPTYMHRGRNVAIMAAFRGDFRLTFFNAALMRDPEGLLEKQGPNTAHAGCLRFTENAAPARLEPVIRSYLAEAMAYAEAGVLPTKEPREIDLPDELVEALDADPDLAEAFHALTPGRQKSYAILLAGAKAPATRTARILKSRDRILAGKGVHDR